MYAIVNISGKQFRAEKGKSLKVPSQSTKVGKKLSYDQVLLTNDNGKVQIGNPFIKNFKVSATVLENGRDKKIIVFKKKRRKGYRVKNGHKQHLSEILIESISKSSNLNKKVKDIKAVPTKNSFKNESVKEDNEKSNLTSKTLSELKEIAKNKKITGYSSMKKADLVKTINSLN